MAGQPGKHQPENIQKLRSRAKGTAYPRHARSLVKSEGGRNIQDLIDIGFCRLSHPSPSIGRERFEISSRSLRIENPQRKRGFTGSGNAGNTYDLIQRNIDIDILQIVNPGASHTDGARPFSLLAHSFLSFFLPRRNFSSIQPISGRFAFFFSQLLYNKPPEKPIPASKL